MLRAGTLFIACSQPPEVEVYEDDMKCTLTFNHHRPLEIHPADVRMYYKAHAATMTTQDKETFAKFCESRVKAIESTKVSA